MVWNRLIAMRRVEHGHCGLLRWSAVELHCAAGHAALKHRGRAAWEQRRCVALEQQVMLH